MLRMVFGLNASAVFIFKLSTHTNDQSITINMNMDSKQYKDATVSWMKQEKR